MIWSFRGGRGKGRRGRGRRRGRGMLRWEDEGGLLGRECSGLGLTTFSALVGISGGDLALGSVTE